MTRPIQRLKNFFQEEPEEKPVTETLAQVVQTPAALLPHVIALRKHLLRALLAIILTTAISFAFTPQIIDWLAMPIGGIGKLQAIEVTEPLGVFMRVALLSGFSLALPYVAFELWLFAASGLSAKARKRSLIAIPAVVIFFAGGMLFAYYIMLPTALPFLLNFMGISTIPRPSSYISFTTGLMFWIGVVFEFPLLIYILAALGLVRAKTLAVQWRLAVVIIAVVAAVITPTVDPVSMSLVMGPMILLYFLSIGLAYIAQGGRNEPKTS